MGTSFISKDENHGFWIRDSLLQIICWAFYNVLNDPSIPLPDWMQTEYKDYLYDCSQGLFVGFTTLRLSEYLSDPENTRPYTELIQYARIYFFNKGEIIVEDEINEFQKNTETQRKWIAPFETKRALKILGYLEDVINDRITIKVGDKIDYEF